MEMGRMRQIRQIGRRFALVAEAYRHGAGRTPAKFLLSGFLTFAFIKLIVGMIFSQFWKKRYSPGE